ncbi:MAG TPA: IS110 family transposase [Acidobacteria bacterium]|nr:IS110 family transposase [Acidobacteriota bacterium]
MSKQVLAGLEVSKDTLVVAYSVDGRKPIISRFQNNPEGHARLITRLTKNKRHTRICLESTGVYGLDVALALDASPAIEVMHANPRAVRDFARALMRRQKTDEVDALVLLEFARRMEFRPWHRPSDAALALRSTSRRIETLISTLVCEKNRLHALTQSESVPPVLVDTTKTLIAQIEQAIVELRTHARSIIRSDTGLQRRFEILVSIHGIGERSGITILGELAVLSPELDARQWVAFAGLAPRIAQSGSSVNKKRGVGKAGNRYLKKALFMPAMTAIRDVDEAAQTRERLVSRGLRPIQATVAVMRKLLHLIYALFRDDRLYQRHYRTFKTPKVA